MRGEACLLLVCLACYAGIALCAYLLRRRRLALLRTKVRLALSRVKEVVSSPDPAQPEVTPHTDCYICSQSCGGVEISICCHKPVCGHHRVGTGSISDGYTCTRHPFWPMA